jgi:uncharacterized protein (TIGR02246 family)
MSHDVKSERLMTWRSLVVHAFLIASLAIGSSCHRSFTPDDRRAVEAVLERQRQAWNRGDLAGYMDGYAPSDGLVFTSGGKIRRGWEATMAAYRKRYGGDRAGMGQLAFEVIDVQPIGADGAVMLGRWRLTGTTQAGSGVFSVVFERQPGGWRIVHDHTSSDPAAAGP